MKIRKRFHGIGFRDTKENDAEYTAVTRKVAAVFRAGVGDSMKNISLALEYSHFHDIIL